MFTYVGNGFEKSSLETVFGKEQALSENLIGQTICLTSSIDG